MAFSSVRIFERWIGSRRSLAPGVFSATAPRHPGEEEAEAAHEQRAAQPVEHPEPAAEPSA